MNQQSDASKPRINVNIYVPFEHQLMAPLQQLLWELAGAAELGDTSMDIDVFFAPHELIGPAVNRIVGAEAYPPGKYVPGALVVSQGDQLGLTCTVFVDGQELGALSDTSRPDELVLSVLEEFLHARIYYQRWEQEGKIAGIAGSEDPLEDVLASRIHDEYVVCRMKSGIVATLPLFDAPSTPGYRCGRVLQYGESVSSLLTRAETELQGLQTEYGQGRLTLSQLQPILNTIVFRSVLDPLARSHAFFDGLPESERGHYELEHLSQPLFLGRINPYWQRIYAYLNETYEDEFRYMSAMIRAISVEVRLLLDELEAYVRFPDAD